MGSLWSRSGPHYAQSGPLGLGKGYSCSFGVQLLLSPSHLVSKNLGPCCWSLLEHVFFISGLLSLLGFSESPTGNLLAKKAARIPPALSDARGSGAETSLPSSLPSSKAGPRISDWGRDYWCPVGPESKAGSRAVWLCPEPWWQ